jgi:sterol desaturase/sphingolipid hydroxylase (fatty acid hydroxylase superfamily)
MDLTPMVANPTAARPVTLIVAIGFMVLEYGIARLTRRDTHHLGDTAASLGVAVGQAVVRVAMAGLIAIPFVFTHAHRLFDFDSSAPLALASLFVGTEFIYYWHHRASHRIRWFWATHAVHHSSTHLNFTAAIRLGWTGNLTGSFLFFVPLAWIGFDPRLVVAMIGLNLLYQFFIHTELVPSLGPIEWIFNTPAQHRVHHASNAACIDRNYGGVLSIFDHLFGTFAIAPADEPLRYGLAGASQDPALSRNPVRIALGEWFRLGRELRQTTRWSDRWRVLSGPPGSSHNSPRAIAPATTRSHTVAEPTGATS